MAPCGWDGAPNKVLNEWRLTNVRDIKKSVISKEKASKCRGRFPGFFISVSIQMFFNPSSQLLAVK